jgi:hypothetical protein
MTPLVDATELARLLGVSRAFIYEHADALGAMRLGTGKKARLRFDPVATREALTCIGSRGAPAQTASNGGDSAQARARSGGRRPLHRPLPGQILPLRPRTRKVGTHA